MTDHIDWFAALQQVGRAMFGKEYVERLTFHERFLLDDYGFLGEAVDERTLAEFIDRPMPGNTPTDKPAYSLVVMAALRLNFMRWQDRHTERWIEEQDLLGATDPFQIDSQKFKEAFAKAFPDQPLDTSAALPNPDALVGRVDRKGIGGRPPKHDWEGMHRYVISIAATLDGLPDKDEQRGELTRLCEEWFSASSPTGEEVPHLTKVREKVGLIYRTIEQERAKAEAKAKASPALRVASKQASKRPD